LLPAGAKVAGWDFYPLENAALARRTPQVDIGARFLNGNSPTVSGQSILGTNCYFQP